MLYGYNLKQLREIMGLTQKDIGNILGINHDAYAQYEREYNNIPIKHLITLCDYFNVSIDFIFGFTKEKQYLNYSEKVNKTISGKRLRELRKKLKYSQTKFAEILNTSFSNISAYERGMHTIATPFLYDICKKYNVSADYLLGKIDYEPKL